MNFLLSPQILYSIIAAAVSLSGLVGVKSCSLSHENDTLRAELIKSQQELQRCITNQAVVQAEIIRQSNEINKYNTLASQYKKELDSKYNVPLQNTTSQCNFDFTIANDLLSKQGYKRHLK